MLGAIIGDIVGSRFEFRNHRDKDFELFASDCTYTDDSVMTAAVADALLHMKPDHSDLSQLAIESMKQLGSTHPGRGYGFHFSEWLMGDQTPYQSYGNGAAMRVSPVAYVAGSLEECLQLSDAVTKISHNHPEGMKGAQVTAAAVFLALHGKTKEEIQAYTEAFYPIHFTIDEIRDVYNFDETCQGSVPQALECFYESKDFEDAIRTAISLGGDSDTIAAITGSIAEAYYGIPNNMRLKAVSYLDSELARIVNHFEDEYPSKTL
jgi:type I restriction enzyme M protein